MTLTSRDPNKISVHVLENLANGQSNVTTLTIQELADAFLQQREQLNTFVREVDNSTEATDEQVNGMQKALDQAATRIVELEGALEGANERNKQLAQQVADLTFELSAVQVAHSVVEAASGAPVLVAK